MTTLGLASMAVAGPTYLVRSFGNLGGTYGHASGINASGQVVGWANSSGNAASFAARFNPSDGSTTDLIGSSSAANAINDGGQIVGYAMHNGINNRPAFHAKLFGESGNRNLGGLGGSNSSATAINNKGQIVGVSDLAGDMTSHATLFSTTVGGSNLDLGTLGGTFSYAADINISGQIVGYASTAGGTAPRAALFRDTGNIALGDLGGQYSFATGINDYGQAVGFADSPIDGSSHALIFNVGDGTIVDLGSMGGLASFARAINNKGQVLGLVGYGNGQTDVFVWENGLVKLVDSLIDPAAGWTLYDADDINDLGQIAATAINSRGEYHALLLTPVNDVPEPGTALLVCIALLGVAATSGGQPRKRS